VRDINAGKNWLTNSGTQTITWVINNSGSPLTYTAPNGSSETVTNDASDLWVGTTRAIDDMAATSGSNALANFKFAISGGSETITMDNFSITDPTTSVVVVPQPALTFGPMLTNGNLLARFSGLSGTNYTIEATPTLSPASWFKFTNVTATAGEFEVVAPTANPSQLFRAVYPSY
jgi:hypothetical protein